MTSRSTSPERTSRIVRRHSLAALDESDWKALSEGNPFVDWRFLNDLEQAGSVGKPAGWIPYPIADEDINGRILSAAPAYLKEHSHGEFVFDWAWARAAQGAGLSWYPKLLVASPFSPVTGPRLLGSDRHPQAASRVIEELQRIVLEHGLSSAGINYCTEHDARLLDQAGWLSRYDWQFHWSNRDYGDFDDFLATLRRRARKNIRAERRKVQESGWTFRWVSGQDISARELELATRCYLSTFALYGNRPMLNAEFFRRSAASFSDRFLVCIASHADEDLACAVFWRSESTLYGRYWGSLDDTRDVHFETCYYQGIDYCIRHGLKTFEPGAQGEHKIRRGFLPVKTRSFHFIRHPGMHRAIAQYLKAEDQALMRYREHLETLSPYAE